VSSLFDLALEAMHSALQKGPSHAALALKNYNAETLGSDLLQKVESELKQRRKEERGQRKDEEEDRARRYARRVAKRSIAEAWPDYYEVGEVDIGEVEGEDDRGHTTTVWVGDQDIGEITVNRLPDEDEKAVIDKVLRHSKYQRLNDSESSDDEGFVNGHYEEPQPEPEPEITVAPFTS